MTQTALKSGPRFQFNPRLIAFAAVMLLVVGYPLYIYIDSELSGGIKHHSDGYTEVDHTMEVFGICRDCSEA